MLEFRPVTRLAEYRSLIRPGTYGTRHEIYLDHANGGRAEVSPELFAILRLADGTRTVEALAQAARALSDAVRRELAELWQGRFFTLRPASLRR